MTIWLRLAVAGLAVSGSSLSADPSLECSFVESSQVEIADCLMETEERVNLAMEYVLGYVRDTAFDLDETTEREVALPALEAAQAAWLDYRDKACAYRGATFGGGSGTGIAIRSCKITMTRARTAELYSLLN